MSPTDFSQTYSIAILLPDLRGGGAERVMVNLAQEFARLGHRVELVLLRAEGEFLSEARATFSVVTLGVNRFRAVPWSLSRYLRKRKPDVLIANMWPLTAAAVSGRALSRYRCWLVLVEHATLTNQYRSWGRLTRLMMGLSIAVTYRCADVVAAVSKGVANDTAGLARLPRERVVVVYNPVRKRPPASAKALASVTSLWNCVVGRRILTVGSLKDQKNHPLLLRAFAKISCPDNKLMLLGQGDREPILRALAAELGISDRVIFAGFHADPSPFYATADLFVLSSDYEGLPTVLIEALSFGLPVVSTDCPSGPAEILDHGRYGTLVSVGDAAALACAMDEALSRPHDREALKRRARDFDPEKAAAAYLNLLMPRNPGVTNT